MGTLVVVSRSWFSFLVGILLFSFVGQMCGGQVVEDFDDFNRLNIMLTDLPPEDDQHDIGCEGFGKFCFR